MKRIVAIATFLTSVIALQSCRGDRMPTAPTAGPQRAISDGAHGGRVPAFFFLPPMVPQPHFDGVFVGSLDPVVEICELDEAGVACVADQATGFPIRFDQSTGPSSTTVRVDGDEEHYIVNWHTSDFALDADVFYRISVWLDGRELGFADVDVADRGNALKNVDTDLYIPLKDDRTLPIKFRVEQAEPFAAVDAYGARIDVDLGVAAGGGVPPGLLENDDRGIPSATLTTFGGGSLGGAVTVHAAGETASFAGGTLIVRSDGSFDLLAPTEPGVSTFYYRIANDLGFSDAEVTVTVDAPPSPEDDDYVTDVSATLSVGPGAGTPDGLLANDDRGFPAGGVTSFGGGELGGSVTDHAPGASVPIAGGSLTVNADGSFELTEPSSPGPLTFLYRIDNGIGVGDATVIVTVNQPSFAAGDAYTIDFGQTLEVPAGAGPPEGLLVNDELGFPLATLLSFGGADAGGAVTDHAAGGSVSFAGGTLTLNEDGSFSLVEPAELGSFVFNYRIANSSGFSDAAVTITTRDDQAPTAIISAPTTVSFGMEFTLRGEQSTDPGGGSVARYIWTLPDGSVVENEAPNATFIVTVDPDDPLAVGTHTYQLEVVDDSGNISQPVQHEVTIVDVQAPTAIISAPTTVSFGMEFTLRGEQSTDLGGGSVARYIWTLPDGSVVENEAPNATFIVTVDPDDPLAVGTHTYQLEVVDDSGNISQPVQHEVTIVE